MFGSKCTDFIRTDELFNIVYKGLKYIHSFEGNETFKETEEGNLPSSLYSHIDKIDHGLINSISDSL